MAVLEEIQKFVEDHRSCGEITGESEPPTLKGYRVRLVCACGDALERWIAPEAARHDLIFSDLFVHPN